MVSPENINKSENLKSFSFAFPWEFSTLTSAFAFNHTQSWMKKKCFCLFQNAKQTVDSNSINYKWNEWMGRWAFSCWCAENYIMSEYFDMISFGWTRDFVYYYFHLKAVIRVLDIYKTLLKNYLFCFLKMIMAIKSAINMKCLFLDVQIAQNTAKYQPLKLLGRETKQHLSIDESMR